MEVHRRHRAIGVSAMGFALIGFIDSMYLTISRIFDTSPACGLLEGCDQVLTSPYALLFGIPLPYWGVAFYLIAFFAAWWYWDRPSHASARVLAFIATAGFVASLYFVYLQAFVIEAFCLYCLISAAAATGLFVSSATAVLPRGPLELDNN